MLLGGLAVLIIAAGLFTWLRTPTKTATIPTISPSTQTKTNSSSTSKAQTGSSETPKSTPPAAASTAPLLSPYGSFVSNHHIPLGSSPVIEQSTCNTNPGAACYIKFSKDGVVRNLATQTTDASGVTSWTWDVQQAGLTQGSWQITAIASLGSQTKTTNDSLNLEIQ